MEEDRDFEAWQSKYKYCRKSIFSMIQVLAIENVNTGLIVQVGDATGTVSAHLRPDKRIKLGHTIAILDSEVDLHDQHVQLKSVTANRINFEIDVVNTANNISAPIW
jgi:hypothetical protein